MPRIKLITFDVMNTIIKTKVSIGEEYHGIARKFGVNIAASRINEEFPKVFRGLWDLRPNFGVSTGISAKEWWTSAVLATFERSGADFGTDPKTFENVMAAADALFEHYRTVAPWTLAESCKPTLSNLRKTHKIGAISNFDDRLENILTGLGARELFDFVIISHTAKICKPYPAIFDMALDKAGLTDGSSALHVGDNIRLDYKAALDAGWNAVWLCKDAKRREEYPVDREEVISDLRQLHQLPILQT